MSRHDADASSGETRGGREAIDRLADRIVQDHGGKITHETARKRAVESARRHDRRSGKE